MNLHHKETKRTCCSGTILPKFSVVFRKSIKNNFNFTFVGEIKKLKFRFVTVEDLDLNLVALINSAGGIFQCTIVALLHSNKCKL